MRANAYVLLAVLLGFMLQASPASAHRANIFAYTEGNEVVSESSFSSGRACQDSLVQVKDAATGALLLEGKTDAKGIFRFPLPTEAQKAVKGLQIVLDAGDGHRGEWLLEPEEYLAAGSAEQPAATTADSGAPADKAATAPAAAEASAPAAAVDSAALEKIVAAAVDKKIAPLKRILLETQEKIRMSDIVGGIGYLIGFAGLLAFFRSKRAAKK